MKKTTGSSSHAGEKARGTNATSRAPDGSGCFPLAADSAGGKMSEALMQFSRRAFEWSGYASDSSAHRQNNLSTHYQPRLTGTPLDPVR